MSDSSEADGGSRKNKRCAERATEKKRDKANLSSGSLVKTQCHRKVKDWCFYGGGS